MTERSTLRVDVPGFDAAEIAREAVAAKMAEAMIGSDDAIRKIVMAAMAQRVDGRGLVNQYPHENKTSFVEWMAQDLIRKAALDILKEKVEALRPVIEKKMEAELKASAAASAKILTQNFIENAQRGYGINVNVSLAIRATD